MEMDDDIACGDINGHTLIQSQTKIYLLCKVGSAQQGSWTGKEVMGEQLYVDQ